MVQVDLQFAFR